MKKYIISIFTENKIGLLNRITVIFTRRHINIESITASESELSGIYRYTIVVNTAESQVEKLVKQIEKQVEVLKAFYHTESDVISREIALYKISSEALNDNEIFTSILNKNHARILSVTNEYLLIEKTGNEKEIKHLFHDLESFGILEFVRSGIVAITKPMKTLNAYLKDLENNNITFINQ